MSALYEAVQHFVTFYSPGTFVSESTTKPIDGWDVEQAVGMAETVQERHGAVPFGFCFSTRARTSADLDSKETARSPMYYLGGAVLTLADVRARQDPRDRVLIANMENNGYARVIQNDNSWRVTLPLDDDDVVLPWSSPTGATP